MILWLLIALVLILVVAFFALLRRVSRLDDQREVVTLYENVEWNTQAAEYVKRCLRDLKMSLVAWMAGLMLLQTIVLFLAIIYVLENVGH